MQDLGVKIELGVEGTTDLVKKAEADVVLIATGAQPILPEIPGIRKGIVSTAIEVLSGRKRAGNRTVIIGGGLVGCETAVWLAQQGSRVTVVEVLNDLMLRKPSVFHANRTMLMDMLRFHGVEILTNTRPIEITDDGVLILNASNKKESLKSDAVVLSVGLESDKKLYEALLAERPNLYLIGDAREPRNTMGAVWDAFEVARAI